MIANIHNTVLRRTVLVSLFPLLVVLSLLYIVCGAVIEVLNDLPYTFMLGWRGRSGTP